jgi:hypothetical protein
MFVNKGKKRKGRGCYYSLFLAFTYLFHIPIKRRPPDTNVFGTIFHLTPVAPG